MEKPSLLVVEDDPDIRELAIMALELGGGFSVCGCDDGKTALEMAGSLRPDLILLDWMMPGMDGGQIIGALKSDPRTAGVPVVFMTAMLRANEIEQFTRLGSVGVIAKPFDPMTLPQQVWDVLNRLRAAKSG